MNYYAKLNPNILLTERCNQSCSYCFAKQKMQESVKKEMDITDFKKIVAFLKNNKQNEVKLMGGEPTLHSQFREVVDFILSQGLKIRLFTNGLFPEELAEWLAVKGNWINYIFNLTTPSFRTESGKKIVKKNLRILKNQEVYASITIDSLKFSGQPFVGLIKEYNISKVRLGIANSLIGNSHWLKFGQYKDFGSIIFSLINKLKGTGVIRISFSCGFVPCMFSSEQINSLFKGKGIDIRGWGCEAKRGIFDVSTDLSIFPCFVLENFKSKNLFDFKDLGAVKKFIKRLLFYASGDLFIFEPCRECPYFKNRECGGPCRGWVINNSGSQEIFQNLPKNFYFRSIYRLLYLFRNLM